MTTNRPNIAMIEVKHRDDDGIVVDCPYCDQEHRHPRGGFHVAVCGKGVYSTKQQQGRTT